MSEKEKKPNYRLRKIILIVVLVAIVIAALTLIVNNRSGAKKQEVDESEENAVLYEEAKDGSKTNTSKKLLEEKTIEGLRITNISLTYQEEVSYLRADVLNTTDEAKGDFNVNLKIIDEHGQEMFNLIGYIPPVESREKTQLDTAVTTDIVGAYDFEISRLEE